MLSLKAFSSVTLYFILEAALIFIHLQHIKKYYLHCIHYLCMYYIHKLYLKDSLKLTSLAKKIIKIVKKFIFYYLSFFLRLWLLRFILMALLLYTLIELCITYRSWKYQRLISFAEHCALWKWFVNEKSLFE